MIGQVLSFDRCHAYCNNNFRVLVLILVLEKAIIYLLALPNSNVNIEPVPRRNFLGSGDSDQFDKRKKIKKLC